jgi:hypothetical protein
VRGKVEALKMTTDVSGNTTENAPSTVEAMRSELLDWAKAHLADAHMLKDRDGTRYPFFSTAWFGLLQKCYWQCEELLEKLVNVLLRLPSVAAQPSISGITKGRVGLQLTLAQCVSVLDQIAFSADEGIRKCVGQQSVLPEEQIRLELTALREFAKKRNEFTHERLSTREGNELCGRVLTVCIAFCESHLVSVAICVERQFSCQGTVGRES